MWSMLTMSVRVKNRMGATATRIQVAHIFRQDVNANLYHHKVWTNVTSGTTTGADMEVEFETGFGDWTNYDYWFVQVELENGEVWSCYPPAGVWLGHGVYKQCYLTNADQSGTVTISVSKGTNGLAICPPSSSSASTDFLRVSGWMDNPKDGWDTCPMWFKIGAGVVVCAAGGAGAVVAAAEGTAMTIGVLCAVGGAAEVAYVVANKPH